MPTAIPSTNVWHLHKKNTFVTYVVYEAFSPEYNIILRNNFLFMSDELDEKELEGDTPDMVGADGDDDFEDDEPLIPDGFHEIEPEM